jgi:hypothetical protein
MPVSGRRIDVALKTICTGQAPLNKGKQLIPVTTQPLAEPFYLLVLVDALEQQAQNCLTTGEPWLRVIV